MHIYAVCTCFIDCCRCFRLYIENEFWYVHSVEEMVIWTVEKEKGYTYIHYIHRQYTFVCTIYSTCVHVHTVACLVSKKSWVRIPPEAAHFFLKKREVGLSQVSLSFVLLNYLSNLY